jgi:DNA-binding transcriptional LysR family regulator
MIDWDDLRYFLAVARAGTLSAAARELDVTQPTVGRRIAAFERRLGAKLFAPSPAGHAPSPTGKRLLEYAERMEADALSVERVASGRDAGVRGLVRITASEWLVDRVLAPLVAPLARRHPGLETELIGDPRHANLVRRDADIAVRPSRFAHQDVVETEVAVVAFGMYASDAYLAERGAPDFERRCEGHLLIAMSESLGKIPDVEWLPRIASKAHVVARSNGRLPMATMAAAGIGITCLPQFLGDAIPALRFLRTPAPVPERQLWLAAHRDTRAILRVKTALAFLREELRRLRPAFRPRA